MKTERQLYALEHASKIVQGLERNRIMPDIVRAIRVVHNLE